MHDPKKNGRSQDKTGSGCIYSFFGCFWCFWLFLAVFAFFDYFFLSVFSLYFACRIAPFSPTNSTVNAFLGVGFGY